MANDVMLKQGLYKARQTDPIWDMYEIIMEVSETKQSFIFQLIEFQSHYGGFQIEDLFRKSKRVIIRKNQRDQAVRHAVCVWSDHDFTFYPYQAGVPYYFEMVDDKNESRKTNTESKATTNADIIRRMTNEQLAEFISRVEIGDFSALDYGVTFCDICKKDGNSLNLDCDGCLRHWLDSPATDIFGLLYKAGEKGDRR